MIAICKLIFLKKILRQFYCWHFMRELSSHILNYLDILRKGLGIAVFLPAFVRRFLSENQFFSGGRVNQVADCWLSKFPPKTRGHFEGWWEDQR